MFELKEILDRAEAKEWETKADIIRSLSQFKFELSDSAEKFGGIYIAITDKVMDGEFDESWETHSRHKEKNKNYSVSKLNNNKNTKNILYVGRHLSDVNKRVSNNHKSSEKDNKTWGLKLGAVPELESEYGIEILKFRLKKSGNTDLDKLKISLIEQILHLILKPRVGKA